MPEPITEGRSSPLGATLSPEGANFSVFSKHATGIDLLLFDNVDDACPSSVIRIDPATNRTYHNGEGNRDGAEDTPRRISFTGKLPYQLLHPSYRRNPGR